eukprot:gene7239-biopygen10554
MSDINTSALRASMFKIADSSVPRSERKQGSSFPPIQNPPPLRAPSTGDRPKPVPDADALRASLVQSESSSIRRAGDHPDPSGKRKRLIFEPIKSSPALHSVEVAGHGPDVSVPGRTPQSQTSLSGLRFKDICPIIPGADLPSCIPAAVVADSIVPQGLPAPGHGVSLHLADLPSGQATKERTTGKVFDPGKWKRAGMVRTLDPAGFPVLSFSAPLVPWPRAFPPACPFSW